MPNHGEIDIKTPLIPTYFPLYDRHTVYNGFKVKLKTQIIVKFRII